MSVRRLRWSDAAARLRWTVRVAWTRLAWPEFLAVATIGFALGLFLGVNGPLQQEVQELETHAAAWQLPAAVGPAFPMPDTARSGADFVAAFMAFLPTTDMRDQQLQTLHGLIGQSGAALSRAEFDHADLAHLPGRRTTVQLTVRADYAAYRGFLHDLLVALPNLSVDRVTMERTQGQAMEVSGALDVRIAATLYYRNVALGGNP